MPHKCETPRYGGVSRKRCGGCFRDPLSPLSLQSQFLIAAHHVRPELAGIVATLVFDGERLS